MLPDYSFPSFHHINQRVFCSLRAPAVKDRRRIYLARHTARHQVRVAAAAVDKSAISLLLQHRINLFVPATVIVPFCFCPFISAKAYLMSPARPPAAPQYTFHSFLLRLLTHLHLISHTVAAFVSIVSVVDAVLSLSCPYFGATY